MLDYVVESREGGLLKAVAALLQALGAPAHDLRCTQLADCVFLLRLDTLRRLLAAPAPLFLRLDRTARGCVLLQGKHLLTCCADAWLG